MDNGVSFERIQFDEDSFDAEFKVEGAVWEVQQELVGWEGEGADRDWEEEGNRSLKTYDLLDKNKTMIEYTWTG